MQENEMSDTQKSWKELARNHPPRTAEAVGTRCAKDGCHSKVGISFEKPLCYGCWRAFDAFEIHECNKCRWFTEVLIETFPYNNLDHRYESICFDCARGEDVPVYVHALVEHTIRFLYILKLDGGEFYVGQTNDLELRTKEHRDGLTRSTRGKNPRLVYFEERRGNRASLNEDENMLTLLNKNNPRAIRRIVNDWQRLMKLVNLDE